MRHISLEFGIEDKDAESRVDVAYDQDRDQEQDKRSDGQMVEVDRWSEWSEGDC